MTAPVDVLLNHAHVDMTMLHATAQQWLLEPSFESVPAQQCGPAVSAGGSMKRHGSDGKPGTGIENVAGRLSIDQPSVVCAAGAAGVSNHAPPRVALLGKPAVAPGGTMTQCWACISRGTTSCGSIPRSRRRPQWPRSWRANRGVWKNC